MDDCYFDCIKEFTLELRDGEIVNFRHVQSNDKELIQKGM
jgi:hypothetical protein